MEIINIMFEDCINLYLKNNKTKNKVLELIGAFTRITMYKNIKYYPQYQ